MPGDPHDYIMTVASSSGSSYIGYANIYGLSIMCVEVESPHISYSITYSGTSPSGNNISWSTLDHVTTSTGSTFDILYSVTDPINPNYPITSGNAYTPCYLLLQLTQDGTLTNTEYYNLVAGYAVLYSFVTVQGDIPVIEDWVKSTISPPCVAPGPSANVLVELPTISTSGSKDQILNLIVTSSSVSTIFTPNVRYISPGYVNPVTGTTTGYGNFQPPEGCYAALVPFSYPSGGISVSMYTTDDGSESYYFSPSLSPWAPIAYSIDLSGCGGPSNPGAPVVSGIILQDYPITSSNQVIFDPITVNADTTEIYLTRTSPSGFMTRQYTVTSGNISDPYAPPGSWDYSLSCSSLCASLSGGETPVYIPPVQPFPPMVSSLWACAVYFSPNPQVSFELEPFYPLTYQYSDYIMYRSTSSGGPWTSLGSIGSGTFIDSSVIPGSTYWYYIQGDSIYGIPYSSTSIEVVIPIPVAPLTPTLKTLSYLSNTEASVTLNIPPLPSSTCLSQDLWRRVSSGGYIVSPWTDLYTFTSGSYTRPSWATYEDSPCARGYVYEYVMEAQYACTGIYGVSTSGSINIPSGASPLDISGTKNLIEHYIVGAISVPEGGGNPKLYLASSQAYTQSQFEVDLSNVTASTYTDTITSTDLRVSVSKDFGSSWSPGTNARIQAQDGSDLTDGRVVSCVYSNQTATPSGGFYPPVSLFTGSPNSTLIAPLTFLITSDGSVYLRAKVQSQDSMALGIPNSYLASLPDKDTVSPVICSSTDLSTGFKNTTSGNQTTYTPSSNQASMNNTVFMTEGNYVGSSGSGGQVKHGGSLIMLSGPSWQPDPYVFLSTDSGNTWKSTSTAPIYKSSFSSTPQSQRDTWQTWYGTVDTGGTIYNHTGSPCYRFAQSFPCDRNSGILQVSPENATWTFGVLGSAVELTSGMTTIVNAMGGPMSEKPVSDYGMTAGGPPYFTDLTIPQSVIFHWDSHGVWVMAGLGVIEVWLSNDSGLTWELSCFSEDNLQTWQKPIGM